VQFWDKELHSSATDKMKYSHSRKRMCSCPVLQQGCQICAPWSSQRLLMYSILYI